MCSTSFVGSSEESGFFESLFIVAIFLIFVLLSKSFTFTLNSNTFSSAGFTTISIPFDKSSVVFVLKSIVSSFNS